MTDPQLTAYLNEVCAWLRIPSVSTQPQHKADVAQAAVWLAEKLIGAGMENGEIIPTAGHPLWSMGIGCTRATTRPPCWSTAITTCSW